MQNPVGGSGVTPYVSADESNTFVIDSIGRFRLAGIYYKAVNVADVMN
jgi:hypothetical protein